MQAPYPLRRFKRISSKFGWRWLALNGGKKNPNFHKGWDFSAPLLTPVYANVEGIALVNYEENGFGHYIRIEGRTLQGNLYRVYFAHLNPVGIMVTTGDFVASGVNIAAVGSTGASTGPHLHWEFRFLSENKWISLNPKKVLNPNLILKVENMKNKQPKLRMKDGVPTIKSVERYEKLLKQKYCREDLKKDCITCDNESCKLSPYFDDEKYGEYKREVQ